MAQDYDKIIRENIEELVIPLAQKVLQLDLRRTEEIPDDLHTTIERRPDFLKKVLGENQKGTFILHIELQVANDPIMVERMLEYYGIIRRKYRLPVLQYVLYLGGKRIRMKNRLKDFDLHYQYRLENLQSVSYEQFLQSGNPAEIILAILGDFKDKANGTVIGLILQKLTELSLSGKRIDKYIKQLEILSKLRNLQEETIKEIEQMALVYDLKTDIRYQQGVEEGFEQGIEKGSEQEKKKMAFKLFDSKLYKKKLISLKDISSLTGFTLEKLKDLKKDFDQKKSSKDKK